MSLTTLAIIGVVLLLILFLLRMPVAYVMALVGFAGFFYVTSIEAAFRLIAQNVFHVFANYDLTVVPMFVFMGSIAFHSGMSKRLYEAAYKLIGHLRGGLALATILACAGFAAMCGSTNAEAAAMGRVTLPEMKRYKYDTSLATGCVAAAGSLGILIPPSTILIIYGILTQESIGRLFAAGILPGLLLTGLFALTIYILCRRNPALAPPGARAIWKERLASLTGIAEMVVLFLLVMGGIFVGVFTPTEGCAAGAAGAIVLALARGQLTWRGFVDSLEDTTRTTAMAFLILVGATVFGRFMAITRVPSELGAWVGGLPFPPFVIMGFIILGYLIGGCFMDSFALVTLTIPVLFPVICSLGFDPIWFGVIIVLVAEMGVITPPVGINVYVIKGVAPDVPLETIFRGIFPFLGAIIVCIAILIAFPQIALFLPSFMTW